MLTLGWSNGTTFIPLNFSLLSSENEKNRINGIDEKIDKRSNGYKRRAESIRKATEVLIDLLNQVDLKKISAKYLLFDS
ncbi:transposase, IS4 family protein [Candidatus Magnetobacterium bavaricum]|uniref:Transposase, IS4 family protein n=1 Tax=Candidatus Magnetobacterium bavaricum TaxID=29290 RepID=A0A0F3GQV3_9BACT|nr:transposase, IS4 family protein [Candidatus Magnetobacterium bavaricum]